MSASGEQPASNLPETISPETFRSKNLAIQTKNLGLVLVEGGLVIYSGIMTINAGISGAETYSVTNTVHEIEDQQPAALRDGTSLSTQLDHLSAGASNNSGAGRYDIQSTAPTISLDEFRQELAWTDRHKAAHTAVTNNLEDMWDSTEKAAFAGGAIALLHMGQRRYKRQHKALKKAYK